MPSSRILVLIVGALFVAASVMYVVGIVLPSCPVDLKLERQNELLSRIIRTSINTIKILETLSDPSSSQATKEEGDEFFTNGLWKMCRKNGTNKCETHSLSCSGLQKSLIGQCMKLMMARMFTIMACIFSFFGAIVLLKIGITGKSSSKVITRSKVLINLSLICGIIGFPIGTSWTLDDGADQIGAAAILVIVATTVNFLSAAVVSGLSNDEVLTNNATVHIN